MSDSDSGFHAQARETLRILRDDPRLALVRLEERVRCGAADQRTWHNLAVARARCGDLAGALQAIDEALVHAADSAPSHFLAGVLRRNAGDYAAALAAFARAAELSPEFPRLAANRGVARFFAGDREGAARDLEAAAALEPRDATCLFNLALAQVALKRFEAAAGTFARLIALEPESAPRYARLLVELGRAQAIEEVLSQTHRLKNFMAITTDGLRRWSERRRGSLEAQTRAELEGLRADFEQIYSDTVSFLGAIRPYSMRPARVDLRRVLERLIFVVGNRCEGIEIVRDFAAEMPSVSCDVDQLQEAFLNLILNALEAVAASRADGRQGRVTIACAPAGEYVAIAVEDNGTGIAEADLDRIFTLGFTTKKLGAGVGLAYTRRVLEDHGGRIEIESRLGSGTRARCLVPIEAHVPKNLANLALHSQFLEDPRELILPEEEGDLGL